MEDNQRVQRKIDFSSKHPSRSDNRTKGLLFRHRPSLHWTSSMGSWSVCEDEDWGWTPRRDRGPTGSHNTRGNATTFVNVDPPLHIPCDWRVTDSPSGPRSSGGSPGLGSCRGRCRSPQLSCDFSTSTSYTFYPVHRGGGRNGLGTDSGRTRDRERDKVNLYKKRK